MFFGSTGAHAIQTFEQSQLSLAPKISIVLLHIISTFNYILTKLHCIRGQSGFFNLALTERNMQIEFDLKLSVYSLGVDI